MVTARSGLEPARSYSCNQGNMYNEQRVPILFSDPCTKCTPTWCT